MHLLSANSRSRTPACVIQFESKDLKTGNTKDGGQEKVEVPAQQRANVLFLSLSVLSIQAFKGLDDAHPCWVSPPLPETPSQTHLETMSYQLSGPFTSVRLTHKISHYNILLLSAFIFIIFCLYSSLLYFYFTS